MNRGKVVIVGAGSVGTSIAYSMVNQCVCDTIAIIDINKDKAYAESLDMMHAIEFMNTKTLVKAGDYNECSDADIVIISASLPMPRDSRDRMKFLESNVNIIKSVVNSVMASGFNGIFLVVSNPVDVMSYYVRKLSGFPRERVIGSGTTLDTARLHYYIAKTINVDPRSIDAFIIGEHGDTEMVAWSTASIGGKDIKSVFLDNKDRIVAEPYKNFLKLTSYGGWDIFSKKGNTSYGIASSVTGIVKSIMFDENRIYPVSVYLNGEYGMNDVFVSVPTIINRSGAKEIVELRLTDEEYNEFKKSCEALRSKYQILKDWWLKYAFNIL